DLSSAGAGRLTFVNPPAPTMNGATAGVTVVGSVLTANYSSVNGPLQPGQSSDVRFRVQIAAGLPAGTILTNTALVTWNNPPQTSSANVSIVIGGTSAPKLTITKQVTVVGGGAAVPGAQLDYLVHVTNPSTSP